MQTTCQEVLRRPAAWWAALGVVVVELGIETVDDSLLRYYRKPQTVKTINKAVDRLHAAGIKIIANILLGLIGETETTAALTREWIEANKGRLYGLNIYTLAVYKDSELAQNVQAVGPEDSDELAERRTFWTEAEAALFPIQAAAVYQLGIDIAQQRRPD